jgi:hypothetical protein
MCDKKSIREIKILGRPEPVKSVEPTLPKSAEQLMEEYNNLHKKGTYMAFQEDYIR